MQVAVALGATALVAFAGACGKKKDGGGSGAAGGGASGGGASGVHLPPPVAMWMQAGAADAWQGVWQSHLSLHTMKSLDAPIALAIKGDTATAFDGTAEHTLAVRIDAPCRISFDEKDGATTWTYSKQFLIAGGKLVAAGDGAGGYRKGKAAVVCKIGSEDLFTLDDAGVCHSWKADFMDKNKWDGAPATCVWSQENGKDVLTVGTGDWSSKLVANGDLLTSEQLDSETTSKTYMTPAADYATAKAWATAQAAAKK